MKVKKDSHVNIFMLEVKATLVQKKKNIDFCYFRPLALAKIPISYQEILIDVER